jgi:hypothetical protein
MSTHADGTSCPEGTYKLPRGFSACCDTFSYHTRACYFDVRYEWWTKYRGWYIVIAEMAGGGGIKIEFCPHCGTSLEKLRSNNQLQRTPSAPLT